MKSATVPLLLLIATACNFDDAFNRYCKNNPRCLADAAADAAADVAPDAVADVPASNDASRGSDAADAGGPSPIRPPTICDPLTPCPRATDICDPTVQLCLTRCTSQTDCPNYLDSCEPLFPGGGSGIPSVCRCSSTQACVDVGGSAFACHRDDRICERLCSRTPDCYAFGTQYRICDRISQLCVGCLSNAHCPSPIWPVCDRVTERCTGCRSNADCASRTDGLTQCATSGACTGP